MSQPIGFLVIDACKACGAQIESGYSYGNADFCSRSCVKNHITHYKSAVKDAIQATHRKFWA